MFDFSFLLPKNVFGKSAMRIKSTKQVYTRANMTPEQQKAFDDAFAQLDEAFAELDKAFKAIDKPA